MNPYVKKIHCLERNNKVVISIKLMEQLQEDQGKKIDIIINKLESMDEKLDSKYAKHWVQQVVEWTLVLLALASVYLIFRAAGLPIP